MTQDRHRPKGGKTKSPNRPEEPLTQAQVDDAQKQAILPADLKRVLEELNTGYRMTGVDEKKKKVFSEKDLLDPTITTFEAQAHMGTGMHEKLYEALRLADVNRDGKVNAEDWKRLPTNVKNSIISIASALRYEMGDDVKPFDFNGERGGVKVSDIKPKSTPASNTQKDKPHDSTNPRGPRGGRIA